MEQPAVFVGACSDPALSCIPRPTCRPSIATVYAPIAYPPLPLLAFKLPESEGGVRAVLCWCLLD